MLAFVLKNYGGPDQTELREIPRPEPGRGQLLVEVHAAGLNPVDYKIRQGKLRLIHNFSRPVTMGSELAGRVVGRGPGTSPRLADGELVFARVAKESLGAFAEYAVVREDLVARAPIHSQLVEAAAVPLAGLTALQCLRDELRLQPGQRVLITGGAGGVGTFAIQIAKWLGAKVTTTASARGETLVRSLGADDVIDYTSNSFEQVLHDLDGAFDLVGGQSLARCFAVVKPGGKVVSIAGVPEPGTARQDLGRGRGLAALFWLVSLETRLRARRYGVDYRYVFMRPDGANLTELAGLIDSGILRVIIDRVFPFSEISAAMACLEQGHAKGKLVVQMMPAS